MDIPDLPPFLAGLAIGSELFPSLNLSYWEPSYPTHLNLNQNQVARRRQQYQLSVEWRYALILLVWPCLLSVFYPLNPSLTILAGSSLAISFFSRHSFKDRKKYKTLSYFHLLAFALLSQILYTQTNDKMVLLGPALILSGGYLIGQNRNRKEQFKMDLLGRLLFGSGFTLFFLSVISLKMRF